MELRDNQNEAIEGIRCSASRGDKNILLHAATGFGKTVVASGLISLASQKGNPSLFLANRRELIYQAKRTINEFGIDAGVIMAGVKSELHKDVQIASMQTYGRRIDLDELICNPWFHRAKMIIVDEAHGSISPTYQSILKNYRDKLVIGLTATPCRGDGRGLGEFYDDIVSTADIGSLINDGYLVPVRYFCPDMPDLRKIGTVAGDYDKKELSVRMDKRKLVGSIVENWLKICPTRQTIVFAVNVSHSIHIVESFRAVGIMAEHIDARTPTVEREAILARLKNGITQIVSNVGILTEGFDFPAASCIVLARPTKSLGLYLQMAGRGLRIFEGKEDCIARDTEILTDKGSVKIQDITLDHRVWDGVSFVEHDGAVCKGIQNVIEYDGLIATVDHEVMTNEGWKKFQEVSDRRMRIIKTGLGGETIRFTDDSIKKDGWEVGSAEGRSVLSKMLSNIHVSLSQYEKKVENKSLSSLQRQGKDGGSAVVVPEGSRPEVEMSKPKRPSLRKIWWQGYKILIYVCSYCYGLDFGKHRSSRRQKSSVRQERQQWSLRRRESSVGECCGEHEQHQKIIREKGEIYSVQDEISTHKICRFNIVKSYLQRIVRPRDNRKMGKTIVQTKREVWDILNAGKLQRFTANGFLVHNCILIDHGGCVYNHGRIEWEREWSLDGEEKAWKEIDYKAKEKSLMQCRVCDCVFEGQASCPDCKTPLQKFGKEVEIIEAELKELDKQKASVAEKRVFLGMLKAWIPRQKNSNPKRIVATFKSRFKVWPHSSYKDVAPIEPDQAFLSYMKSMQIRYAKRRRQNV